jgi:hypothetical protein
MPTERHPTSWQPEPAPQDSNLPSKPVAPEEGEPTAADKASSHEQALLDESLEESFPASDPVTSNQFT